MSNKLCVYTCITGDYDDLNEIENPEKHIDYYCFTNNKSLKSKTWKIVQIDSEKLDNRLLARKIKILGHPTINNNYNVAVWTDADVVWQTPISEFVKTYFKNTNFAIFKHHDRNTIHEEAIACLTLRKDSKENIVKLLDYYKNTGFLDDNGLCESTVFIKNPKDSRVIKTTEVWYDMVKNYSQRDQLSFNYAAWKTGLKVTYIKLNVWGNPWFSTNLHNSEPKIDSCHIYYGDPYQEIDLNKYYIYEYQKTGTTYRFNAIIPCDTKEIDFKPTMLIGVKYQNLTISPKPDNITASGVIMSISCNPHSTFHAYGNFKKGDELSFFFTSGELTISEAKKLIKLQWEQNGKVIQNFSVENARLIAENVELQKNLHKIIDSKGWQMLEKMRKLIPRLPKKSN